MVQGMRPRPDSPVPHLTLLGCLAPCFVWDKRKNPYVRDGSQLQCGKGQWTQGATQLAAPCAK